jgi:CheY-like chemotaxis protein
MSAKDKRVLIVDDDPDIVESLKIVLESEGYQVDTAASGKSCLERVEAAKPDLVILDVMMDSTTDGFHTSYELKKDPVYKEIPVVMLTAIGKATGMHFDRKEDPDYLPVEEFIEKPVDPKILLATVKKYVE